MKKLIKECKNCKDIITKTMGEKAWKENKIMVEIDLESTNYTCGVSGLVDFSNVKISKSYVYCSKCDNVLYSEKERNSLLKEKNESRNS